MKLIGDLAESVRAAESKERVKELIRRAGMELTDEELEYVAGGNCIPKGSNRPYTGQQY